MLKKFILARQAEHGICDKRLEVQDSILLKHNSLWQGRQNGGSGTRGFRFRTVFCCKKNILARQAKRRIRDERL